MGRLISCCSLSSWLLGQLTRDIYIAWQTRYIFLITSARPHGSGRGTRGSHRTIMV